jgi:hypothetical protein
MKIRVQWENGCIETISLDGHWEIIEGKFLNSIRNDRGMEHFFTKKGFYDGWEAEVGKSLDHAVEVLAAMLRKRKFDPN